MYSASPPAWHAQAACYRTVYSRADDLQFEHHPAYAVRICEGCQVRQVCLDSALAMDDVDGVDGGLSVRERYPLHVAYRAAHGLEVDA